MIMRKRLYLFFIFSTIGCMILLLFTNQTVGWDWNIVTLFDENDTTVYGYDIAIDDNGYPHITYATGFSQETMVYMYWDGHEWINKTLETNETSPTFIEIDSNNNPHILYEHNETIKYLRWNRGEWITEVTKMDDVPYWISMYIESFELDSNDHPHFLLGGTKLIHVTKLSEEWRYDIIIDKPTYYGSMVLDSNDEPIFFDQKEGQIIQIYINNDSWITETITDGIYSSFTIDKSDNIHLIFENYSSNEYEYCFYYGLKNNNNWNYSRITYYQKIWPNSIYLDEDGNPHIACLANQYWQNGRPNATLCFVRKDSWSSTGWNVISIDNIGDINNPKIVIDKKGYAHILYSRQQDMFDNTESSLEYSYRQIFVPKNKMDIIPLLIIIFCMIFIIVVLVTLVKFRKKKSSPPEPL